MKIKAPFTVKVSKRSRGNVWTLFASTLLAFSKIGGGKTVRWTDRWPAQTMYEAENGELSNWRSKWQR